MGCEVTESGICRMQAETTMLVRQRSGEGIVRRNGRPKGVLLEYVSSLPTEGFQKF